jgi:hypothetical protein
MCSPRLDRTRRRMEPHWRRSHVMSMTDEPAPNDIVFTSERFSRSVSVVVLVSHTIRWSKLPVYWLPFSDVYDRKRNEILVPPMMTVCPSGQESTFLTLPGCLCRRYEDMKSKWRFRMSDAMSKEAPKNPSTSSFSTTTSICGRKQLIAWVTTVSNTLTRSFNGKLFTQPC